MKDSKAKVYCSNKMLWHNILVAMEVSFKLYCIKKEFFLTFFKSRKFSYIYAYGNISMEPYDDNDIGGWI